MKQKVVTLNASGMKAQNLRRLLEGVEQTYGVNAYCEHRRDGLVVYVDSWRQEK